MVLLLEGGAVYFFRESYRLWNHGDAQYKIIASVVPALAGVGCMITGIGLSLYSESEQKE